MAFRYEKCMVEVMAIFSSVFGIFSNSVLKEYSPKLLENTPYFLFFQLVLKNLATNLFFHLLNCVKFELDIQHFTRVIDLIQFLNPAKI